MMDGELKCPKCRNNILIYECNPNHEMAFKCARENLGNRFRMNKGGLEVYINGNWKPYQYFEHEGPKDGQYGCGIFHYWFFCKCGFSSRDEDDFLNNDIRPIEEKVYKNGRKYIGQFKNGKREGYGIMFFPDGGRYEGNWKDDLADGKGIEYYSNGDRYEGDYYKDEEDGNGVYYYKNGDRIMGDYRNGKMVGKHVKLCANGEIKVINNNN